MKALVGLASLIVSAQAYSATTIGNLTYDETTNLITISSGTQYLGFDVLAGYTYQETVQATAIEALSLCLQDRCKTLLSIHRPHNTT
jgi:uncharacterized membrane protein YbhN (UPF0104 family)